MIGVWLLRYLNIFRNVIPKGKKPATTGGTLFALRTMSVHYCTLQGKYTQLPKPRDC